MLWLQQLWPRLLLKIKWVLPKMQSMLLRQRWCRRMLTLQLHSSKQSFWMRQRMLLKLLQLMRLAHCRQPRMLRL